MPGVCNYGFHPLSHLGEHRNENGKKNNNNKNYIFTGNKIENCILWSSMLFLRPQFYNAGLLLNLNT